MSRSRRKKLQVQVDELAARIKALENMPEAVIVDVWKVALAHGWQLFEIMVEQAGDESYKLTAQQYQMLSSIRSDLSDRAPTALWGKPLEIVEIAHVPQQVESDDA
jgi:hypothetical protein